MCMFIFVMFFFIIYSDTYKFQFVSFLFLPLEYLHYPYPYFLIWMNVMFCQDILHVWDAVSFWWDAFE